MVPREPLVQLFWLTAAIRRATNSLTNMSSAAQSDISDASLTKMSSAAQPDFNELPCIPADYSRLRITELNSLYSAEQPASYKLLPARSNRGSAECLPAIDCLAAQERLVDLALPLSTKCVCIVCAVCVHCMCVHAA